VLRHRASRCGVPATGGDSRARCGDPPAAPMASAGGDDAAVPGPLRVRLHPSWTASSYKELRGCRALSRIAALLIVRMGRRDDLTGTLSRGFQRASHFDRSSRCLLFGPGRMLDRIETRQRAREAAPRRHLTTWQAAAAPVRGRWKPGTVKVGTALGLRCCACPSRLDHSLMSRRPRRSFGDLVSNEFSRAS